MPPRAGRGRGGPPPRGGGPALRGGPAPRGAVQGLALAHVESIGVKRPGFGNAGRALEVYTNHFTTDIPTETIHHYDVISPSEKTLPASLNFEIIKTLQETVAPQVFTPRGAYDGRKNLFAASRFTFGDSAEFDVALSSAGAAPDASRPGKGPKVYKVRLTHVAEVNPEVLARFLQGQQSHDNTVLTAITALNVVVRMEPNLKYPFNVRSFFTNKETKDIGFGIELWRGYFQSVRPAIGRMLINVDISTGAMYKPGPLLSLCLEFLGKRGQPDALNGKIPERERLRVQKFISGIRILTPSSKGARPNASPRVVKRLSKNGANELTFRLGDGPTMTVAEYFRTQQNQPLQYPGVLCVELASGALLPLELCKVPPGQIIRKQLPPETTIEVLSFATKKPQDRLQSIRNGLGVLAYGQSQYVRQFGMNVGQEPVKIGARVLVPPTLRYGAKSRQPTITPKDGAWNMIDKRLFQPGVIENWIVVVYERHQRFNSNNVSDMIAGLTAACNTVGASYYTHFHRPHLDQHLRNAGITCRNKTGALPTVIVVILPEGGNDIYNEVKHFGDISAGVVTQCMKSSKCSRAKPQYYANVTLKLNVKLGGINTVPDPRSVSLLADATNPTIVMGADVIHPAPGSDGRPSFTALVGNVDSDTAKYIATIKVQTSRQEIIEDLESMTNYILSMYMQYRQHMEKKANPAPKRIIFFRDGVSEGQFQQVLDKEACAALKIKPQITMIVVGKRHHVRFFPRSGNEGDRSGNCPAGTVVDREVVNPVEFDFYLQSHGGLLGTSRPAHYNVLYDENKFTPDGLQSLCFALCHVYARSTRSVSIPAPVYYADIVCSRAKHHYDPRQNLELTASETATNTEEQKATLAAFKAAFKPLHTKMSKLMYFC
ncbi:argonaute-like protein [Dentipellis sp. KUC8613]|nr:argonaute-like protein [Dentipellis sp. KUC8613]